MAASMIDPAMASVATQRGEPSSPGSSTANRTCTHPGSSGSVVPVTSRIRSGVVAIAASISEESDTIMDVYEPFLLQCGFLQPTPRGRTATPAAYRHLGLTPPRNIEAQPALWESEEG